jgi:hypothetical protein
MYLIDTVVYSEVQRASPAPQVLRFLDSVPESLLYSSVIVLGELFQGVRNAPDEGRARRYTAWIHEELIPQLQDRLLPVSAEVARRWGEISGEAMRRNEALPLADALIAATADVHGLIVVTRNERDFLRCGARVRNPWTDE